MRDSDDEPDIWTFTRPETAAILVLDDVGAERANDWTLDRLYLLINERIRNCAPMVCTTNYPPESEDFRDRVSDRIASRIIRTCDVIEIVGRP
jgi:DNA replication protein DnaC